MLMYQKVVSMYLVSEASKFRGLEIQQISFSKYPSPNARPDFHSKILIVAPKTMKAT